jgi:hypothetical protein
VLVTVVGQETVAAGWAANGSDLIPLSGAARGYAPGMASLS